MAAYDTKQKKEENLIDINSGTQRRKIYNKKGRTIRIVCIVLSVIFLISGSGMLYYYSVLNSLNYKDISDNDNDKETVPTKTTLPGELVGDGNQLSLTEGELLQNSKVLNVMLFGEENMGGSKYGRSDTMIMMSIDNINKKLKLTSFQRDTYVYIPGYGYNKLNASYNYGGAKLSIKTIETNFGIKIDRYAVVDFDSFKKIIDTLGGIDLELTEDEIAYINYQMYKNGQTTEWSLIKDEPGMVHLTGQQALWYARNRGLSKNEDGNEIGLDGDDWDRTSRQRKLVEKLFSDFKNADLAQIISIVGSVGPLVTTNLKKDEITRLVSHSLKYLQYETVQFNIPSEGMWYYDDNTVVESGEITSTIKFTDLEEQRLIFAEFIYEDLFTETNDVQ